MKIIILGSGDSYGMPVCIKCKPCKRALKDKNYTRTRTSILIKDFKTAIFLICLQT